MEAVANIPDAPFRSGTTGKYKLLIKDVTRKYDGYEYELVDADGKEYKAVSPKHYAPDQLLRCMVHFKVANAAFVVTEMLICSKQDFAIPIPEPPKPQPKPVSKEVVKSPQNKPAPKVKAKDSVKKVQSGSDPQRKSLGDPYLKKVPGKYVLRVAAVEQGNNIYTYKVEDAKGRQYEVQSKHLYPMGTIVDCKVHMANTPSGALRISVITIAKHITQTNKPSKKHKKWNPLKNWHAGGGTHDWPSPSSGDHFHLIYTPMGNKR